MIQLRPHHALCSQFFTGHGYSKEFVENMTDILNLLNTKNPKIKFVDCCDDICSSCPNNKNGNCRDENKIREMDKGCLDEFNFNIDEELYWNDIKSKVMDKIDSQSSLPSICDNCQWLSICRKIKFENL